MTSVDDVKNSLPDDIARLLTFEDTPQYVIARPKAFLGEETFYNVAKVFTEIGGEYVGGLGKQSHFRVDKSKFTMPEALNVKEKVKETIALLTQALSDLTQIEESL